LTALQRVHQVYRDVLHDKIGAEVGTEALRRVLRSTPIYNLAWRCFFAFITSSTICGLSFGGSLLDMWVSGVCSCALQYLGLSAAHKSSLYANVYERVFLFFASSAEIDAFVGSLCQSLLRLLLVRLVLFLGTCSATAPSPLLA